MMRCVDVCNNRQLNPMKWEHNWKHQINNRVRKSSTLIKRPSEVESGSSQDTLNKTYRTCIKSVNKYGNEAVVTVFTATQSVSVLQNNVLIQVESKQHPARKLQMSIKNNPTVETTIKSNPS